MSTQTTPAERHRAQLWALFDIRAADLEYRRARREARDRLRDELTAALGSQRAVIDAMAYRAFEAGIPKRQIGKAMGTTDAATVTASIERGRSL